MSRLARADYAPPRAHTACRRLLAAAAAAAVLLGCGVRTEPRPPEHTMPKAPDEFSVAIEKDEVRLAWQRPRESEDGHTLDDLAGFRIERAVDGGAFELLADVPVRDRERVRPQNRFKWRDLEPLAGRAAYRVRAYTDDGQAGTISAERTLDVDESVVEHARELRDADAEPQSTAGEGLGNESSSDE
jgi:hypothetical protein